MLKSDVYLIITASAVSLILFFVYYQQLRIYTFDPVYARTVGIVFTALFAAAVILVSRCADDVHLDIDIVLICQVLFAPLNRIELLGISLSGCAFGYFTDISISSSVASVSLATFLAVFFFNKNGWIRKTLKTRLMLRKI